MLPLVWSGEERRALQGLRGRGFTLLHRSPGSSRPEGPRGALMLTARFQEGADLLPNFVANVQTRQERSQRLQHGGMLPRAVRNPLNNPDAGGVHPAFQIQTT